MAKLDGGPKAQQEMTQGSDDDDDDDDDGWTIEIGSRSLRRTLSQVHAGILLRRVGLVFP